MLRTTEEAPNKRRRGGGLRHPYAVPSPSWRSRRRSPPRPSLATPTRSETETYLFHDSYVGCSDTSTVSAWVAPLVTAEGEEVVCGPAAADAYGFVDAEFDGGAVWAEATANPDIGKSACDASITETLSLDLVAPAVE